MTTTTRNDAHERRSPLPTSNGNRTAHAPAVAPPRGRVRLSELAVGLLVTVTFALAAVLWHLNATSKVPALAAATTIERGEMIEATDLRVVYVASDDPLALMSSGESNAVVGRVALVDLAAGTLLTPAVVADAAALQEGDGVVGLALDPGPYPAIGLAPGDRVDVVQSEAIAPDTEDTPGTRVIARGATVFAVEDLSSDRKLVSILTTAQDAEVVAAAAGSGGLRLVMVAP